MIEFFKFIKGYVYIKVTGFSPERFVNLCGNHGMLIWNLKKKEDAYYLCISVENFFRLRSILKKTGTKVVIIKKCGLPFLLPIISKKSLFLIGFIIAIIFWIWSSNQVWNINVLGNYKITDETVLKDLKQIQIQPGIYKKEINTENIERFVREKYKEVTWVSAKVDGTNLNIEMKENDVVLEKIEMLSKTDTATNLVAEKDGVIVSIVVRNGITTLKPGDKVKKGDVLVSGSIPVYLEDGTVDKYQYCNADADIIVEHKVLKKEKIQLKYLDKIYTGREKKKYCYRNLNLLNKSYKKKISYFKYDIFTFHENKVLLDKIKIPTFFEKRVYREYYLKEEIYSTKDIKDIIKRKYNKILESFQEKGVQIIKKNVKIDKNNEYFWMTVELVIQEKIGESRKILHKEKNE